MAARLAERRVLGVARRSRPPSPAHRWRAAGWRVWRRLSSRITGSGQTGLLGGAMTLREPNSRRDASVTADPCGHKLCHRGRSSASSAQWPPTTRGPATEGQEPRRMRMWRVAPSDTDSCRPVHRPRATCGSLWILEAWRRHRLPSSAHAADARLLDPDPFARRHDAVVGGPSLLDPLPRAAGEIAVE